MSIQPTDRPRGATRYPHTLVLVSHDRAFLNDVCTDTIDFHDRLVSESAVAWCVVRVALVSRVRVAARDRVARRARLSRSAVAV